MKANTSNNSRKMMKTKQNFSKMSNIGHNNSIHQQSLDLLRPIIEQQRSKSKCTKTNRNNLISCKQILSLAKKRETYSAMENRHPNPSTNKLKQKKKKKKITNSSQIPQNPTRSNYFSNVPSKLYKQIHYGNPLSRSNSFIVFSDKNTTPNATIIYKNIKQNTSIVSKREIKPANAATIIQKMWRGYRTRKLLQNYIQLNKPKVLTKQQQNSFKKSNKNIKKDCFQFHQQFLKLKINSSNNYEVSSGRSQNMLKYIQGCDPKISFNPSDMSSIKMSRFQSQFYSNMKQSINNFTHNINKEDINENNQSSSQNSSIEQDECFKRQKAILPGTDSQIQFDSQIILQGIQDSQRLQDMEDDFSSKLNSQSKLSANRFPTIFETNEQYATSFKKSLPLSKKDSPLLTSKDKNILRNIQKQKKNDQIENQNKSQRVIKSFKIQKIKDLQFHYQGNQAKSKQGNGFQSVKVTIDKYMEECKKSLKQKLNSKENTLEEHLAKSKIIKDSYQAFNNVLKSTEEDFSRLITKIYQLIQGKESSIDNFHQQISCSIKKPQSEYFTIQGMEESQQLVIKNKQTLENIETIHSRTGLEQLGHYIDQIYKQTKQMNEMSELQYLCEILKHNSQNGTENIIERCLTQFLVQIIAGQYSIKQVWGVTNYMIQKVKSGKIQKQSNKQKFYNNQIQLIVQRWSKQVDKWEIGVIQEVQMEQSSILTDFNQTNRQQNQSQSSK